MVKAILTFDSQHFVGDDDKSREFQQKSAYGEKARKGTVLFSVFEAFYLFEKGKVSIMKKKELIDSQVLSLCKRQDKLFLLKYVVYKDLRSKGYVVKTGLKFGSDFRVYDKSIKPGDDHAKWIVHVVKEAQVQKWNDFAAKNRVSHSTRKRLLIAIVDIEQSVSYFEVDWVKI